MKKKIKQSPIYRYRYLLSVLGAVILLVGALLIVRYALPEPPPADHTTVTYDPIEGEGTGQTVFPSLSMDEIQNLRIDRTDGAYAIFRSGENNEFYLAYEDESGEMQMYYPPICELDPSFSYSSLFATEAFGEVSIARLYNLCQGIGNVRFSARIPLESDAEARAEQLRSFGFSDQSVKIQIWHTEVDAYGHPVKDAEMRKYTLTLGERVITGVGYYVMLEGRDYIYATATDSIDYANKDYPYYISTRITPAGLSEDGSYEPYLTTGFKQWKNVWYRDKGTVVADGSRVTVSASEWVPHALGDENPSADGYIKDAVHDLTFHLASLSEKAQYSRLMAALVGQRIGALSQPMHVTLVGDGRTVTLSDSEPHTYRYVILCVESALTSTEERTDGTVGDAASIKVTYDLYIDGEKKNAVPMHGIIDLSLETVAGHKDALSALSVGQTLDTPYEISVIYDENNADQKTYELYLTEIIAIYNQKYETVDTVAADSIISYHYYYVIDGEKQPVQSGTHDLSKEEDANLIDLLVGKKKGELAEPLCLRNEVQYLEIFADFITYEIHEIDYFVTEELVVSFSFQNASERDPFYAESLYQNTLPSSHPHSIYPMNYGTCQTLISLLGGLGSDTTQSIGLSGIETVAVGLTPEIMEKYGLYAHTLYFELPRGIYSKESMDRVDSDNEDVLAELEDEPDDYGWYNTLGVKLYISEKNERGNRYVATDLYETVVEIGNESFVFLDYDFIGFWTRRQPVMVHVGDVEKVEVEYNMSDLSGKLSFRLEHILHKTQSGSYYDEIVVRMSSVAFPSRVLADYLERTGLDEVQLNHYYNAILGGGSELTHGSDYAGTGYFKEAIQMLYYTSYRGTLSDEDRAAVSESADQDGWILRYKITVESSAFPYVFEFYRLDDRRVAVRLYQERPDGSQARVPTADFYISTYAFKRFSGAYIALANAEAIDPKDFGYGS